MEIKVVGSALVIVSDLKKATIEKAAKFAEESLVLVEKKDDEETREVCKLSIGKTAGISKFGIVFDAANKEGNAQATIMLPAMKPDDRKQYIEDNYGLTLVNASKIEGQVDAALEARSAVLATIMNNVEVD